jgi:hypothetical protein
VIAFFAFGFGGWPFDPKHPRRTFITWGEDLNTNSVNIHVAKADGAPGFEGIVRDLAKTFGASGNQTLATKTPIDNWHSEWDSVGHPSHRLSTLLEQAVYYTFHSYIRSVSTLEVGHSQSLDQTAAYRL